MSRMEFTFLHNNISFKSKLKFIVKGVKLALKWIHFGLSTLI
jgi:hypothetical protein